jgi:hypothetical protein
MKNFTIVSLCLTLIGYICFAGYLANDFAVSVRSESVAPLTLSVLKLTTSNERLNIKIEKARNVVQQVHEENGNLKNAVRMGAEMLQAQIEENADLHFTIEGLEWRLEFLENQVKPPKDIIDVPTPYNSQP